MAGIQCPVSLAAGFVTDAVEAAVVMGLGGLSIALFCRVGSGIYSKTGDVADLVADLVEGDPRNPSVVADNVGDVAGMGSDLFGGLTGSSCGEHCGRVLFALVIGAAGIFLRFARKPPRKLSDIKQQVKFCFI